MRVLKYFDDAGCAERGSAFRRAVTKQHFHLADALLSNGVAVDDVSATCGYTSLQNEA